MTPNTPRPLLDAAAVIGCTLRRDLAVRSNEILRVVTRQPQDHVESIGWRIVNMDLHGRNFRYRVTDNDGAHGSDGPSSEPIWAINIHGYFAGGSMYARESEWLARRLGWRVVNPSLPGFGGSDPLDWGEVTINSLSDHIDIVRRELGISKFVLLGHSMGGAVAVDYASRHANDVLGLIYRDGVATPQWQARTSLPTRLLSHVLPDAAPMMDLMSAIALDAPDLLVGHMFTTIRSLIPDLKSNVMMVAHSAPVATMLLNLDLTSTVRSLATTGVPIYGAWGCFDRIVTMPAAASFAEASGVAIQWVPGGHSWMLARPSGQSDLLTEVSSGTAFIEKMLARRHQLISN
jgi:pimeloyl-ACP methyl ester carboxylesterase